MANNITALATAQNTQTSELLKLLDKLKDSKIANELHEDRITKLCGAIKTINTYLEEYVEFEKKQLERAKEIGIEYSGNGFDEIRDMAHQVYELAGIIEDMAGEYCWVPEIFYHYKEEYAKGN